MNGLYSGPANTGETHRAVIPATSAFNITGITQQYGPLQRQYMLDAYEGLSIIQRLYVPSIHSFISGVFIQHIVNNNFEIKHKLYAHRNITELIVVEIELNRNQPLDINLNHEIINWFPSPDITFQQVTSDIPKSVSYKFGQVNAIETEGAPDGTVFILYDKSKPMKVSKNDPLKTKWFFLTSISNNKEDVFAAYNKGTCFCYDSVLFK